MPDGCHRDIGQSYTMVFTQQTAEGFPLGRDYVGLWIGWIGWSPSKAT